MLLWQEEQMSAVVPRDGSGTGGTDDQQLKERHVQ